MGSLGKDITYRRIKALIETFVTSRREKPTISQIVGQVKSALTHNILTKEEIMQILGEVEQGIKGGAIAPMSSGKEERYNQVKGAIENLLRKM